MKYLVILVTVVVLVRADFFLRLFDKLSDKMSTRAPEVQTSDLRPSTDIVPFNDDSGFRQSPKQKFFALLIDFKSYPTKAARENAMEYLKAHPTIFTSKLDPELEAVVFSWRDLLNLNQPELVKLLIELSNFLQGENQLMIKRFFSLWMEIHVENFIVAYSQTKDSLCSIATILGDRIPDVEKSNEYHARLEIFKGLLKSDKLTPAQSDLVKNCILVLEIKMSKRTSETEGTNP